MSRAMIINAEEGPYFTCTEKEADGISFALRVFPDHDGNHHLLDVEFQLAKELIAQWREEQPPEGGRK
jgi:hypothetical protein